MKKKLKPVKLADMVGGQHYLAVGTNGIALKVHPFVFCGRPFKQDGEICVTAQISSGSDLLRSEIAAADTGLVVAPTERPFNRVFKATGESRDLLGSIERAQDVASYLELVTAGH